MSTVETAKHIEALVTPFRRRARVDHAEALDRMRLVEQAAAAAQQELADSLRASGASWRQIGEAAGISKQAAQQRWGRKRPAPTDAAQLTLTD